MDAVMQTAAALQATEEATEGVPMGVMATEVGQLRGWRWRRWRLRRC